MDVQVVELQAVVKQTDGEAIIMAPNGQARLITEGSILTPDEILIVANGARVRVDVDGKQFIVDENCAACLTPNSLLLLEDEPPLRVTEVSADVLVGAPLENGEFSLPEESLQATALSQPDDLAAIQEAILLGADPTELLEATAAGGSVAPSEARVGLLSIIATHVEVIPETHFETMGIESSFEFVDEEELYDPTRLAEGGQSFSGIVSEGSITLDSYPQSIQSTVLIAAGERPLNPASFTILPANVNQLLTELASEIRSNGETVSFNFDSTNNQVVGSLNGEDVLSVRISAQNQGLDAIVSVQTTVFAPIDHSSVNNSGLIRLANDQIILNIQLTGQDEAGVSLLSPLNLTLSITDGVNPSVNERVVESTESVGLEGATPDATSAQAIDLGSDYLSDIQFVESSLDQLKTILSNNQATEFGLSEDGRIVTVYLEGQPALKVAEISLNLDGSVNVSQYRAIEQSGNDDVLVLDLSITATDYDNDTITTPLQIKLSDGQDPVISGSTGQESVDEATLNAVGSVGDESEIKATGRFNVSAGSDEIQHYEIVTTEFLTQNTGLQADGNPVTLTLSNDAQGDRIYTGYADGTAVFSLALTAAGDYTFTLLAPLQHEGSNDDILTVNFPIYAVDTDGDRSFLVQGDESEAFILKIDVSDDSPTLSGDALSDTVIEGDSVEFRSEVFTALDSFTLGADSGRVHQVILDRSGNGTDETFTIPEGSINYEINLQDGSGSWFVSSNGDIYFEANRDVYHYNDAVDEEANALERSLQVVAIDGDGDIVDANNRLDINVTINDGALPLISSLSDTSQINVTEAQLTSGSKQFTGLTEVRGELVASGSDDIVSFVIDDDQFAQLNNTLSAGNNPVSIQLKETTPSGVNVYSGIANSVEVFTVSLTSAGQYTFTLYQALDHDQAGGDFSLDLVLPIYAIDSDKNVSTAAFPLTINVQDDTAVIKQPNFNDEITEGSTSVLVNVLSEVTQGADGARITSVSYIDHLGSAQTVQVPLGSIDLEVVLADGSGSWFVSSNGNVYFDSNDNIYHYDDALVAELDSVERTLSVNVTDNDGDDLSSSIDVVVEVNDGALPTIQTVDALSVSENAINRSRGIPAGSSPSSDNESDDGNVVVLRGSDDVVGYKLNLSSITAEDDDGNRVSLTYRGQAVTFIESPEGSGNYLGVTNAGGRNQRTIIELTLDNEPGSATFGKFEVELIRTLDHDIQGTDFLRILIPVVAIDNDNDLSAPVNLELIVNDDVPYVKPISFEVEEGATRAVRNNVFSGDGDKSADGNTFVTEIEVVTTGLLINGDQSVSPRSGSYDVTLNIDGNVELLGQLTVTRGGAVRFVPEDNLPHNGGDIDVVFNITAQDRDGDESTNPLNIKITDSVAEFSFANGQGSEDAGRSDTNLLDNVDLPNDPIKIDVEVMVGDNDNNESLSFIEIDLTNNPRGAFYFFDGVSYQALAVADGNATLSFNDIESTYSNGAISIDNLYFVPDSHWSGNKRFNVDIGVSGDNREPQVVEGRLTVAIEAIADTPTWSTNVRQNTTYYQTQEDGDDIALRVRAVTQDSDRSEVISYQIQFANSAGHELYISGQSSPLIPNQNGVYELTAAEIRRLTFDPADDFSGQVILDVTAITTERSNNDTVQATQQVVIDVTPNPDSSSFTTQRIAIFEDNLATQDAVTDVDYLLLSEVVNLASLNDVDGSEEWFIRVSGLDVSGAALEYLGDPIPEPNPIKQVLGQNGDVEYYEISANDLNLINVVPLKDSHDNFTFNVEGVIKDTASLSTGETTVERIVGEKVVNVDVKGVADIPQFAIPPNVAAVWSSVENDGVRGVETNISENGRAFLNFDVETGEVSGDGSERVSVILSNIPAGVRIENTSGEQADLAFVGYDSNDVPMYEANLASFDYADGIQIIPEFNSATDLTINASIIVTEIDGHAREFDGEIRVVIDPVISAQLVSEDLLSQGIEDERISINWHPSVNNISDQVEDSKEFVSRLEFSQIPEDSVIYFGETSFIFGMGNTVVIDEDGVVISGEIVDESGAILSTGTSFSDFNIEDAISNLDITPSQDRSADITLDLIVTVAEIDPDTNVVTTSDLYGTALIRITPELEVDAGIQATSDNQDVGSDGVTPYINVDSDSSGALDFVINGEPSENSPNTVYLNNQKDSDGSAAGNQSEELLDDLIVEIWMLDDEGNRIAPSPELLDALLIRNTLDNGRSVPANNNGDGTWMIQDANAFSIIAPNGLGSSLDNQIGVTIHSKLYDEGDIESENDRSFEGRDSTSMLLTFPETVNGRDSLAAEVDIAPDVVITGAEDQTVNLGRQLTGVLSAGGAEAADGRVANDTVSVVFEGATLAALGVAVNNAQYNYVTNQYIYRARVRGEGDDAELLGLNNLSLTLPDDFSGDFDLPFSLVTTDNRSGDENTLDANVQIEIQPEVDEPLVELEVVGTAGLTTSLQPVVTADDDPNNDVEVFQPGIALEDGVIELNIRARVSDTDSMTSGEEVIEQVVVTLTDTIAGVFIAPTATNPDYTVSPDGQSIVITGNNIDSLLSSIAFKPDSNFPPENHDGNVSIRVASTVRDTTSYDLATPSTSPSEQATFETDIVFNLVPVVDEVVLPEGVVINSTEGAPIALSAVTADFGDQDESEQLVSLIITGVPIDFRLESTNEDYSVKNNGEGKWSIQPLLPQSSIMENGLSLDSINLLPPENFSGQVQLGIDLYTQENLLNQPTLKQDSFSIDISPVGDIVDLDLDVDVEAIEGENVEINLSTQLVDSDFAIPAASGGFIYNENSAETLLMTVSGIPEGAQIGFDAQNLVTITGGSWTQTLTALEASQLDKLVFNSGEASSATWDGQLTVQVRSDDNGILGEISEKVVNIDVAAVNDAPINTIENTYTVDEGGSLRLNGIAVSDIDYQGTQSGKDISVALTVDYGVLDIIIEPSLSSDVGIERTLGGITLTGPIDSVNLALQPLDTDFGVFYDAPTFSTQEQVNLTITTSDGGVYAEDGSEELSDVDSSTITITPVAAKPSLDLSVVNTQLQSVQASLTASNAGIPLAAVIATLADPLETLTLEISGLSGATLESGSVSITDQSPSDTWTFTVPSGTNVDDIVVNSLPVGAHTLTVTAISEESNGDTQRSDSIELDYQILADSAPLDSSNSNESRYIVDSGSSESTVLTGSAQNDIIIAGDGGDTISGGLGDDILTGNAGDDTFVWLDSHIEGLSGVDEILDFHIGDQIDISQVLGELNGADSMEDLLTDLIASERLTANFDSANEDVVIEVKPSDTHKQTIVVHDLATTMGYDATSTDLLKALIQDNIIKTTFDVN
ncbi:retention module-containing protein [Vibrio maerlii]|uniref:retention module-containing protein n=1 Tax=Vibrio maerlii TaxID=2231648 RepID=UPI000E3E5F58|nr:retention module-containing protein [Vibrio maerlii]